MVCATQSWCLGGLQSIHEPTQPSVLRTIHIIGATGFFILTGIAQLLFTIKLYRVWWCALQGIVHTLRLTNTLMICLWWPSSSH
jgi:hypothetical protein